MVDDHEITLRLCTSTSARHCEIALFISSARNARYASSLPLHDRALTSSLCIDLVLLEGDHGCNRHLLSSQAREVLLCGPVHQDLQGVLCMVSPFDAHRPPRRASTKCNVAPPSRLYSAAVLSSFLRTVNHLAQIAIETALILLKTIRTGLRSGIN